ncbi:MAG: hypothetical protein AAFW70_16510 [Cyanobacteria bacterium J06635_10]
MSRFLNLNSWSTRKIIREIRTQILEVVLKALYEESRGRRPFLQVIVDLTTLEKRGKFKEFEHLISVYNDKRGLHLVVLYLVVGKWRIPWSFRVWRGKGTPSQAQLGLKLIKALPKLLTKHFQVMILADTAFGSIDFLHGIRKLKYHAITGLSISRKLVDGRVLRHLHKTWTTGAFSRFRFSLYSAWYYLKRENLYTRKKICFIY